MGQTMDWPVLMQAGLRGLGLQPAAFWALTPAEFLILLGDAPSSRAMARAQFDTLSAQFPDRTEKE